MSKNNHFSSQPHQDTNRQNRHFDRIENKVGEYTPDIELLLEVDTATTDSIKKSIEKIEALVKENNTVTTHQIRNIFALIKDVDDIRSLNMIRPKLSYISARQRGDHGKVIAKVVDKLIVNVTQAKEDKQAEKMKGLKYIMESIVAYHKFHVKEK